MVKMSGFDFEFDPSKCENCGGKCCVGESGYIFVSEMEIENLAKNFNLESENFKEIFCYRVGEKFSLKEKVYNDGYACVFFDEKNRNCGVYDLRPFQCRSFPFWDYFKRNFKELERECIGVKGL